MSHLGHPIWQGPQGSYWIRFFGNMLSFLFSYLDGLYLASYLLYLIIPARNVAKLITLSSTQVTTSSFTPVDSHTLYVGSGQKIYTYDLRMEAMILSATDSAIKVYDGAEDEINQVSDMALNRSESVCFQYSYLNLRIIFPQIQVNHRATFLASCDDSGDVRVLDLKTHKWMRPLERKHSNVKTRSPRYYCLLDQKVTGSSS